MIQRNYLKDSNGNVITRGMPFYTATKANGQRKIFSWAIDAEQYAYAMHKANGERYLVTRCVF